jgi:hypothetical protein
MGLDWCDCRVNLRPIFDFLRLGFLLFPIAAHFGRLNVIAFTFLFPLKKSNKRKLVAVFFSIHFTFEIVTNSVISVELPLGTHISIRFILSKNNATLDLRFGLNF